MVGAIGSAPYASYAVTAYSAAGLEAQLDRYRQQLSDWVNCPSCNTIEGKNKIAQISARIGEVEAQMKAADAAKRNDATGQATPPSGDQVLKTGNVSNDVNSSSAASGAIAGTPGSRLDIFA